MTTTTAQTTAHPTIVAALAAVLAEPVIEGMLARASADLCSSRTRYAEAHDCPDRFEGKKLDNGRKVQEWVAYGIVYGEAIPCSRVGCAETFPMRGGELAHIAAREAGGRGCTANVVPVCGREHNHDVEAAPSMVKATTPVFTVLPTEKIAKAILSHT